MILASVLITSHAEEELTLPRIVTENMASFRAAHPDLPHVLFTMTSIRELLRDRFGRDVLSAFDTLKPFSYKADLARYCIMYQYGGVYADVSMFFFRPWPSLTHRDASTEVHTTNLAVFSDFGVASPWDTVNGMFAAPPRHPALARAIDMVCSHVRDRYYGPHPLCPTGPTLFGKAIATTCDAENLIVGTSAWVGPVWSIKRRIRRRKKTSRPTTLGLTKHRGHGLVFQNEVIAVAQKWGGTSVASLGIKGGNAYVEMWMDRRVYDA